MTQPRRGRPPKATAEDWERAALDAVAAGGLAAVTIDRLAEGLGTTKGSFYGYFDTRDALVRAALARWEQEHTEATAATLAAVPDPAERLRQVVVGALSDRQGAAIALNLLADAGSPEVSAVVERVTQRRVEVLRSAFADLGLPAVEARHRALGAYSLYLGVAALRRGSPAVAEGLQRDYVESVLALLERPV